MKHIDIKPYRENQPEKESIVGGILTTCYHQTTEQFEAQRIIDLRPKSIQERTIYDYTPRSLDTLIDPQILNKSLNSRI